jgi:hypothetical protein
LGLLTIHEQIGLSRDIQEQNYNPNQSVRSLLSKKANFQAVNKGRECQKLTARESIKLMNGHFSLGCVPLLP